MNGIALQSRLGLLRIFAYGLDGRRPTPFPLSFLALVYRRGWKWKEAARIGTLTAAGFFVSGPFLTESGLGTGEAYNYSQAAADAVVQMRAGVFPVLVGQSVHAFNGRVHPLRTAMFLAYSAGALDAVTFHKLSFWGLQNLSLAVALFGALFSAYACLRRLGTLAPCAALFLALLYGLSAPLLAAAYGMDLYMTVAAAPFLPLALLGAIGTNGDKGGINPILLAAGLAGTWLAHPPVAAWATVACLATALASTLRSARGTKPAARAATAGALFIVLGGFAFVSVSGLGSDLLPGATAANAPQMAKRIIETVDKAGWATMRPVRDGGGVIGDFQLGYALWVVLAAGGLAALASGSLRGAALLASAIVFAVLSLPVPHLNAWLWRSMPGVFSSLTNDWPMQRSFLVVAACALFLLACAWPAIDRKVSSRLGRTALGLLACACLGWSVFQATSFVRRGYAARIPSDVSRREQLPGNVNLTQTAYSFLDLPRNFTFGPRDPESEMRLLGLRDGRELQSNAKGARVRVAAEGRLVRAGSPGAGRLELSPKLILEPGKRYRLRLTFVAPRMNAVLHLDGKAVQRSYLLPRSGGPNGFGMDLGNANTLPLWTDLDEPEAVTVSLLFPGSSDLGWTEFAEFTLEELDRGSLPARLGKLVPFLEGDVDAPQPCWLETPRMAVRGYEAVVDGSPAPLGRSIDGTVLISVPEGRHRFELRYRGPVTLRAAFAASAIGWAFVFIGMFSSAFAPRSYDAARRKSVRWLDSNVGSMAAWLSRRSRLWPVRGRALAPGPSPPRQANLVGSLRRNGGPYLLRARIHRAVFALHPVSDVPSIHSGAPSDLRQRARKFHGLRTLCGWRPCRLWPRPMGGRRSGRPANPREFRSRSGAQDHHARPVLPCDGQGGRSHVTLGSHPRRRMAERRRGAPGLGARCPQHPAASASCGTNRGAAPSGPSSRETFSPNAGCRRRMSSIPRPPRAQPPMGPGPCASRLSCR